MGRNNPATKFPNSNMVYRARVRVELTGVRKMAGTRKQAFSTG